MGIMGTTIIARRLSDKYVQYGWSGNDGYFSFLGAKLLEWYQDPKDVEYLFKLGQKAMIGKVGSEVCGFCSMESNNSTIKPFWVGETEREIFSRMDFIKYSYFYDFDCKWYYIIPGPFRVKIPLELVANLIDEDRREYECQSEIQWKIFHYLIGEYLNSNNDFQNYLNKISVDPNEIIENLIKELEDPNAARVFPLHYLFDKYYGVFSYFDDWILIKANPENTEITEIVMKKKEEEHIETNNW